MDAMIVIPATGDFMAKMANGITDNVANLNSRSEKLHYFGEVFTCLESQSLNCERRITLNLQLF